MPAAPAAPPARTRPDPGPEPLSSRDQFWQDFVVALGPALAALLLAADLERARLLSEAASLSPLVLLALPAAVWIWHKAARPAPPPPASRARRVLTRAVAAVTAVTAAAGIIAVLVLAGRHDGVGWWDLPAAALAPAGPLLAARSAARRSRPARSPAPEHPPAAPGGSPRER